MPTTIDITTTYAGEFAGKYIAAALFSATTLDQQAITIEPNVKYQKVVKKLDNADIVADSTCDFEPTGTVTLTEKILAPKKLQVNQNLCKEDFEDDWEAVQMGYSAFDNMPPNFTEFFIANQLGIVGDATEVSLWQGVAATAGEFKGFTPEFKTDATVVDVDNTGVTIDSTTVIAQMGRVYDAMPAKIFGKPDVMFYCSQLIVKAYQTALGGFGASGLGSAGVNQEGPTTEKPLFFNGIPIVIANGLVAGEMVLAQKSNLWFGTGLMADYNQVKVLDMADLDGSQNVRYVMRYTADTQYGIGAEIVYYWTVV